MLNMDKIKWKVRNQTGIMVYFGLVKLGDGVLYSFIRSLCFRYMDSFVYD